MRSSRTVRLTRRPMQKQKSLRHHRPSSPLATLFFVFVVCTSSSLAQEWPDKILGYKVHDAKISISNSDILQPNNSDALVRLTDPTLADIGFSGATIEISASVTSTKQNGSIDFVTFRDIYVNGFKVDVLAAVRRQREGGHHAGESDPAAASDNPPPLRPSAQACG